MKRLACLALIFSSSNALAIGQYAPMTVQCVNYTNARYKLPPNLLWAVKEAEGAGPGVIHTNPNKTKDLGSWQHNTATLSELSQYGVTGEALLHSECASAYVAGWKLAKAYERFKSWKLAVAAYNCGEGCVSKALKKKPTAYHSINELDIPKRTKNIYIPSVEAALYRLSQYGAKGE